jgi:hypothetical protein
MTGTSEPQACCSVENSDYFLAIQPIERTSERQSLQIYREAVPPNLQPFIGSTCPIYRLHRSKKSLVERHKKSIKSRNNTFHGMSRRHPLTSRDPRE